MKITLVQNRIFEIRNCKVMLDFHLAELYDVETKRLKEAVRRNITRFPSDFMFELTRKEYNSLRSQIASLKTGRGHHVKYMPYAFTEQGVAMLSSILNSEKAIKANIVIIRTFVLVRQYPLHYKDLEEKIVKLEKRYKKDYKQIFVALQQLLQEKQQRDDFKNRRRIGFKPD